MGVFNRTDDIKLGDRVKDIITGLSGIAVARTDWLNGCVRWAIQAEKVKEDGTIADYQWVDAEQVRRVDDGIKVHKLRPTGGPQADPKPRIGQ